MLKSGNKPRASTPGPPDANNKYSSYNSVDTTIQQSMLIMDTSATDLITASADSDAAR